MSDTTSAATTTNPAVPTQPLHTTSEGPIDKGDGTTALDAAPGIASRAALPLSIDPRELRTTLGHFATGVTVVTCYTDDGAVHGATVNAFTGVSLDPPLVLVSINRSARMCQLLPGVAFAINVLDMDQRDTALHFAGRPCLDEIAWESASSVRAPMLPGCLASIACAPWRTYDGGDHTLFLGEVQEFRRSTGRPLLFHSGEFHALHREQWTATWNGSGDGPAAMSWISEATSVLHARI
jgi:flavin reductase (DIM6/NTAB) family NADH-FMN oxidoreductase RutF